MKLLVITGEVPDSATIRDAVRGGGDDTEVYVVAPALEDSPLRFWVSDVDGAIARANEVLAATVKDVQAADVLVAGEVGEAEPLQAAKDALAVFPADRVLILTHEGDERAYREEELDAARAELGVPVDVQRVTR